MLKVKPRQRLKKAYGDSRPECNSGPLIFDRIANVLMTSFIFY